MRSIELKQYIESRQALFWYSPAPKSETVSDELLVEHILNYGSMDDVRELFKVLKIRDVANIFFNSINKSERRKGNYFEKVRKFYIILFCKYANSVENNIGYEIIENDLKQFLIEKSIEI